MKHALIAVLLTVSFIGFAQEKPLSPSKTETGEIDGVKIEIHYNAPSVRGRAIWGSLVPYGEVWRTGANEATTIEFASDVIVDDQPVPAGKYALFMIPNEDNWTVILNTAFDQWGAYEYDASLDVARIEVESHEHAMQEQMEIVIEEDMVMLHWEKKGVHFTVKPAA